MRFRAFYADSYADVLRFVRRRTPPGRAEDVTAEAFLVAWRELAPADQEVLALTILDGLTSANSREASLEGILAAPPRLPDGDSTPVRRRGWGRGLAWLLPKPAAPPESR